MKKLINDPNCLTQEGVEGFALAHADIVSLQEDLVVVRASGPVPGKVGLVSGGGSGHEPLHVGFVGVGMLDAAVVGQTFTSPTPPPLLSATRAADTGAGVLHIVKNYTGDVLNFETAQELAAGEGIEVATVLVADDIAVESSLGTPGRRGLAGTVLVEKVAGAAAERGDDLASVVAVARRAVENVRTMGVALSAPEVPHVGRASFDLPADEIEIGVGIHGEPGRRRAPHTNADAITETLLAPLMDDLALRRGEEVVVLVNGMGATPGAELAIVYRYVHRRLEAAGVRVARSLVGSYVTSLDMQGVSVTLMRTDPELLALYDAPVRTAALRWGM